MRLVTIRTASGTRAGRVDGQRVVELDAPDVGSLLANPDWADLASADGAAGASSHALDGADLASLVPFPSKIICLGLNYASHIKEMGHELPEYPTLFAKFPGTLIGARDPILLPRVSEQVDWEVELGVVIGRRARHVSVEEAPAAIAGYTVVNDVSVRDYQRRTSEFLSGKIFERTTPVGPALVTLDELPGGGADLAVRCEVDGAVMQESRTSDLLFGPAEIIAYVSDIITLEPGDLIATGTPAGVGAARTPPVWLRSGQVVRTVVEGVGECVNRCVPELASG
jgi:acylpyruvate hydrolase